MLAILLWPTPRPAAARRRAVRPARRAAPLRWRACARRHRRRRVANGDRGRLRVERHRARRLRRGGAARVAGVRLRRAGGDALAFDAARVVCATPSPEATGSVAFRLGFTDKSSSIPEAWWCCRTSVLFLRRRHHRGLVPGGRLVQPAGQRLVVGQGLCRLWRAVVPLRRRVGGRARLGRRRRHLGRLREAGVSKFGQRGERDVRARVVAERPVLAAELVVGHLLLCDLQRACGDGRARGRAGGRRRVAHREG